MLKAAQQGLQQIFKPGFYYQRAGILLPDLLPVGVMQMRLLDAQLDNQRAEQLMTTLDAINHKHGKHSIRYASEMLSQNWRMRQQFKSPAYTTDWQHLLTVV